MKKILILLMVASLFSLVACGPSAEEQVAAEAEAAEMVKGMMGDIEEAMDETTEELVAHVCDEKCEGEAGCTGPRCGEAGHECSEVCKAEHTCGDSCNTGTHKCGEHCGCGEGCGCAEGATCSDKCDIKKTEDAEEA